MSKSKNKSTYTRRKFVGTTLAAGAGISIVPSFAVSGLGHKAPSDKLNNAGIITHAPVGSVRFVR